MDKSLPSLAGFGAEPIDRKHRYQQASSAHRIDHLPFGDGGMDIDTAQLRDRQISRKSFLVDRSLPATIQGIAHRGTGLPGVEAMSPFSDFFIAGEEDPNGAMRQVGAFDPGLSDFHDDGDPCLVVATQQRGPHPATWSRR